MQQSSVFTLATKISGLACPRCTSVAFHKHGRKYGIQRYRCTCCNRTFNETVNTPFHRIRDKQKMQDYLITMHNQQSIRAASKQIGISVPTSFSWRHRILASLKEQTPMAGSSPAGISEIILPHSCKGKRGIQNSEAPDTHSLLIVDARGIPSIQLLVSKKKTFEAACMITNTLRATTQIKLAKTNLLTRASGKISLVKIKNRSEAQPLQKLTTDTAGRLMGWMARFNGVATKYLQQYWNWFRAESNSQSGDIFRAECFGQRQLQYYRQIAAT